MYLLECVLVHKGQCPVFFADSWYDAMLVFVIVPVLDMITGEIGVGEHIHGYEERCSFIISVQDNLHCAIADIEDIANKTLLLAIDDLDLVLDLDCVLGGT